LIDDLAAPMPEPGSPISEAIKAAIQAKMAERLSAGRVFVLSPRRVIASPEMRVNRKIVVCVVACFAVALAAAVPVGDARPPTGPVQPQAESTWLGHRGRVQIRLVVKRHVSFERGSFLSALLTWPGVRGTCEVFDPSTRTFQKHLQVFTVHEDSTGSTFAGRIVRGRFALRDTYGGRLYRLFQGTFTRNRVRGTDQVFGPPAQCTYGPLSFDLLRQ
jgi:hypothetical protein